MFTGIISSIGKIKKISENVLTIETNNTNFRNLEIGTSIAEIGRAHV